MSDNEESTTTPIEAPIGEQRKFSLLLANHRIAVLVIGATLIAFVFSGIGLYLYHSTGTAQIDLSRMEYRGVAQDTNDQEKTNYTEYPETGPINSETLAEFKTLFDEHVDLITSVDAFSGDPLAPDALQIESKE